jgi:hypothetical protein
LGEESEKVTTIAELSLVMARDIAEIEVEADTVIAGFSGWNQGYQVEVRKKQDGEIISSHQLSLFFLTGRLASEGRDSTNQMRACKLQNIWWGSLCIVRAGTFLP